jgi:hypothetical protein
MKAKKKSKVRKYVAYDGELEAYYETGMECLGLVLYKDGFEKANPDYIEGNKEWPHCVPFFRSYDGQEYIEKGDILIVMKEDGITPERTVKVLHDPEAADKGQYRLSIYMKGVSEKEVFDWFAEGLYPDGSIKKPRRAILKKLLK